MNKTNCGISKTISITLKLYQVPSSYFNTVFVICSNSVLLIKIKDDDIFNLCSATPAYLWELLLVQFLLISYLNDVEMVGIIIA